MENNGATYIYVTMEEAADIMSYALSNWKITYHYTKDPERAELNMENPDNGDVMEIRFYKDKLSEISIFTDDDILVYEVKEEEKEND